MKSYIRLIIMIYPLSTTIHTTTFDYVMTTSIENLYKREERILSPQEALDKLVQVGISFWNSNMQATLNFIKQEKNSIKSTLQALSFIQDALNLGQALQQAQQLAQFESQYLLSAIVLDKITLIARSLHGKTDAIQFNQEHITQLHAQLTTLLDSLHLIRNKHDIQPLQVALHTILPIAQPDLIYDKKMYPMLYPAHTITAHFATSPQHQKILKPYQYIVQTHNDHNSGYRTIITSMIMHAIYHHDNHNIDYLKKLITQKFIPLFVKYDQLFAQHTQMIIAQTIQNYLLEQIEKYRSYQHIEQLRTIWNQEPLSDFYMIKFLKYFIIDYVEQNPQVQPACIQQYKTIEAYQKQITAWNTELTELECTILAKALQMNITLYHEQSVISYTTNTPNCVSYLIKTDQHYDILISKK